MVFYWNKMEVVQFFWFKLFFVYVVIEVLEAVTVNPLCPTNKIAPHRRERRWDYIRPRTFGVFYDLLAPDNWQGNPSGSLLEQPQEDLPDDCGEIEDYDENDVSSATTQTRRRQGHSMNRLFNNYPFNLWPMYGGPVASQPQLPFRPQRPTRPPYWSGGYFENNPYRPPIAQNPSNYVKPVHEDAQEPAMTYRPGLVGAPLGHVVGVSQITPTQYPPSSTTKRRKPKGNQFRTPPTSTQSTLTTQHIIPHRQRKINNDSDSTILGSFINLLFK